MASDERNHHKKSAIVKRHDHLMKRWNNLLSMGTKRRERLASVQNQYKDVEDLFLAFAKKASAFNSWFENAEEDLTDPVRCNSIDEIQALQSVHGKFKESLTNAKRDYETLAELDKKIKAFKLGPNPYTWFTMEAIYETWRNLQKIIKERDADLKSEYQRQLDNDKLRQEYAQHADRFHKWINDMR